MTVIHARLRHSQHPRPGSDRGGLIRMIRHITPQIRMRDHYSVKDMESSRRFLLQAEIEYWHEMLRINRHRLDETRKQEMRGCLKTAMRALNARPVQRYRSAA